MNTQTMVQHSADSASKTASRIMTKEDAQQKSDAELLQLIEKAAGHTNKDFREYMHCDFSYTYLTSLMKDRGYESGWHKISDAPLLLQKPFVINMKKSETECCRQSFMIEKEIYKEWKLFNKDVPYKTVTFGHALRIFMNGVKSGLITFVFEI